MFIMELMVLYDLKCNFFILSQTFERKNGFLYDLDRDIIILSQMLERKNGFLYDLDRDIIILSQMLERKDGFSYDLDRNIIILGHILSYLKKVPQTHGLFLSKQKSPVKMQLSKRSHVSATQNKKASAKASAFYSGDGGIRTRVPRRANAFRVRPVMTTSIHLHMNLIII